MNTTKWRLWLRWSWRDLRRHWLQVAAIALIIALGTGTYSGLISTTPWRQMSNDASYAALNMYDLRLTLTEGSYLDADKVRQAVGQIPHTAWIKAVEPRLIVPTLVDASTAEQTIIVPGRLIGEAYESAGTHLNGIHITSGRDFTPDDAGQTVAVLEHKFAARYGLPPSGEIRLSGDKTLTYIGTGLSPEYFMIFTDEGGMMAEANFAALFVPLETVQRLTEHPGLINDVLFTLARDADPAVLRAELEAAVRGVADVGARFMKPDDDQAYHMLYSDIYQDEQFWRWMAYIFLLGAVFGAFNLATRLVESQRREIGIQMALGVPPRLIAIRPLLVAAQIAILGVIFGVLIGLIVGNSFGRILEDMIPLPVMILTFQSRIFLEAAALGIILPLLATLYPVVRALRVQPVEAITTGHLVAKGGGFAPFIARLPLPGTVLTQMPLRNLMRAPRRALLTLLGVAAAIAMLVLIMGALDSFAATLDKGRAELLQANPQRMIVQFNFFYPSNAPVITNISQLPQFSAAEPVLKLGGYLKHNGVTVESALDLVSMESALWHPSLSKGSYPGEQPGLLLSENAARDLGVQPGDRIILRHPKRTGLFSYDWAESEVEVSGIHPLPLRFQAYMDLRHASLMGLAGLANAMHVLPAPGVTISEAQRALFNEKGVASAQPVNAVIQVFDDLIGEFVAVFGIMQIAAIVLVALLAYNSTSISLDERVREIATLFAFGVRVRTALRVLTVETLLTSILGIAVGCFAGFLALTAMLTGVFNVVIPEISMSIVVQGATVLIALAAGVLIAVLTPMLSARKLSHMDIPSTLRVME